MLSTPHTKTGRFEALSVAARDGERADRLLAILPGVNIVPEDFVTHRMIEMLMDERRDTDVAAIAIASTDYLEDDFSARFHRAVIEAARAAGYHHIALLGVSLGVFGAIRYLRERAEGVDDLLMIAPFLGTPGTVAEVERAGGLMAWAPEPPGRRDIERSNLLWLKAHLGGAARPTLSLGFGAQDRFSAAMEGVARHLAPERVTRLPGAHDFETWVRVWQLMVSRPLFCGDEGQG